MKRLTIAALSMSLLSATSTLAGTETGNGGRIVECPTTDGSTFEFLDLHEARNKPGWRVPQNDASVEAQIQGALDRISREISPRAAEAIKMSLQSVWSTRQPTGALEIQMVPDVRVSFIRSGCRPAQMAVLDFDLGSSEGGLFVTPRQETLHVNETLMNQLPPTDQAAFRLHEAVYRIHRYYLGVTYSEDTRKFIAKLFAGQPLALADLFPEINDQFVPGYGFHVSRGFTRSLSSLLAAGESRIYRPAETQFWKETLQQMFSQLPPTPSQALQGQWSEWDPRLTPTYTREGTHTRVRREDTATFYSSFEIRTLPTDHRTPAHARCSRRAWQHHRPNIQLPSEYSYWHVHSDALHASLVWRGETAELNLSQVCSDSSERRRPAFAERISCRGQTPTDSAATTWNQCLTTSDIYSSRRDDDYLMATDSLLAYPTSTGTTRAIYPRPSSMECKLLMDDTLLCRSENDPISSRLDQDQATYRMFKRRTQ